jgi:hypothetical protein
MTMLEKLKNLDRPELLALINRDEDAKKVLLAWTCVTHPAHRPPKTPKKVPGSLPALVKSIWANYPRKGVPYADMAVLSGVPPMITKLKWEQLRRAGFIFPDGTAKEIAMVSIRGSVALHLRPMAKT